MPQVSGFLCTPPAGSYTIARITVLSLQQWFIITHIFVASWDVEGTLVTHPPSARDSNSPIFDMVYCAGLPKRYTYLDEYIFFITCR